ncbi:MFS transporter [Pseudonocardia spinosispora]|uniref:MFS transporter n=1 Tax=Pseudonocardia spinosispora TaxID=103441 RepID=UPI000429E0D5|nr:MFS transporter [Pseudonocardia spinosispora]
MTSGHLIDDAPLTSFHKKLTAYSSGGPFIDGYALTVIGIALISLAPSMGLSNAELGLVGAASLVGVFVGGLAFGYLTDLIGRQVMYIVDLLVLAVASIGSAFAPNIWVLIGLRFVLGVAIGADYPIATSLLAEYLPRRQRGRMLGAVFVVWAAGAAVAYAVGFLLRDAGPDAWRWLLASPAVFAVITLLLRLGTPESARWLLSKGRVEEADAAIKKVYGPEYDVSHLSDERPAATSFGAVFRRPHLGRTAFVSVFWTAQVIPLFAVYTFAPNLFESFGMTGDVNLYGGSLIIAMLFVVGGIPGLWLVERIGRRALLLWSFGVIAVALALRGTIPQLGAVGFFVALAVFALASGASSFLEVVYPNELFPTEVRATAVGVGTAVSRIGSAVSTYLLPLALLHGGTELVLLVGAAVSALGWTATLLWAPETRGRSLSSTSGAAQSDAAQPEGGFIR